MLLYSRVLKCALACFVFFIPITPGDSFDYNSYNNHGVIGLINMPSARFYPESSFGITLYDGTPDQKMTITASPYEWLEASFFYTNIQDKEYLSFNQSYKDKGFNFKLRLKEEGILPAIAVGINDIAGTGLYSSEYIVASYGKGSLDMHFGLGWGALNGSDNKINNPLTYIHNSFKNRPISGEGSYEDQGGQFQPSRYFSNEKISPFYGVSYSINKSILFKAELDTTVAPGLIGYELPDSNISLGFEYKINKNFTIGISNERDTHFSLKFVYKKNPSTVKPYEYKKTIKREDQNKYGYLIQNLESNGIGVNRILESADSLGIEFTQFSIPNLDIVEDILYSAKTDSGIEKDIKYEYKIADLTAYSEFDENYIQNSNIIFQRKNTKRFNTSSKFSIRPFIASREQFFKFAVIYENNSEFIIQDNFFFSSNLKYTIKDNFGDFRFEAPIAFPAEVRSDVKEYLKNFENRIIIGRAQFDYHITPKKNNHIMLSAGILEEMFSGFGLEYLYFDNSKNFAVGMEIFNVSKRDYDLRFGQLDYKNTTAHLNFYYRNYDIIPFDAKISYGEYLAGDTGATFELSRSYLNGAHFGVFASFTDVTSEQFGEGTFDKGIFFNIPIYKNFINYTWRPLTKDPGAKLLRKHTLHDLLIKFRPYNK